MVPDNQTQTRCALMVTKSGSTKDNTGTLLDGLQEIYKKKILPLEKAFKFDYFYSSLLSEKEIEGKPMVLLLGQYSTGKTTFIQGLLEKDYPGCRIGPEPTVFKMFCSIFYRLTDLSL